MTRYWLPYILLLSVCLPAFSEESRRHHLTVGPEIYSLHRRREGGTSQTGTLYGGRAIYDYLGRYKIYVGFEGAYATGTIDGRSGGGDKIRSHFTDAMVEARLGYTLNSRSGCRGWLTPFVGWGYFWEQNDYTHPTPLSLHFRNRYEYFALGCLSRTPLGPCFTIGLDATARFSMNGKVRISHDPDNDPTTLKYEQKVQCRVVLPLTYVQECLNFRFAPFFEYRHYGRRNAYPFDFLDTRIRCYGADLQCVFKF